MKKIYVLAATAALMLGMTGCKNNDSDPVTPTPSEYKGHELYFADHYEVTPLADRLVSLGTYTSIDEDRALSDIENLDLGKGGCSACCKVLSNGDLVFGRNMDLSISEQNVYLFSTNYGKYKTHNIMYFYGLGPTYAELRANGLEEKLANLIPYMSTDVLNEKGLYLEMNMRASEFDEQGNSKFGSTGTNPGKKHTYVVSLAQYLGSRCATIDEVLDTLKNVDVYTKTKFLDWPIGFLIGDATGRHGALEFINNEVIFTENADINTNFFVDKKYYAMEKGPQGLGRRDVLRDGLPSVNNEYDMHNLMAKIYYSYMFKDIYAGTPYLHADFRSDFTLAIPVNDKGELDLENGKKENSTIDWILDEKNRTMVEKAMYMAAKQYLVEMDEAQRRASHGLWYSTIHCITNTKKGTMTTQLWEDPYLTYTLMW